MGGDYRVFVVWEKVLFSDWASPGAGALSRIPDARAVQFWDPKRLVSHNLGETSDDSKVWDWVAVYPAGTHWNESLPKPAYSGRPLEDAIPALEASLASLRK